jgi:hypothetical protein
MSLLINKVILVSYEKGGFLRVALPMEPIDVPPLAGYARFVAGQLLVIAKATKQKVRFCGLPIG